MRFSDVAIRPRHTDVQRFAYSLIACAMSTDIGHPIVLLVFGNTIASTPCPVNQSRKTASLVHVPSVVLVGEDAPFGIPMQQVVRRCQPCLIASSVQSVFSIVDHIGNQPFFANTEDRWAVYLMVVVSGGYHHTIFIRSAHLIVDALHVRLWNDVSSQTAEHHDKR